VVAISILALSDLKKDKEQPPAIGRRRPDPWYERRSDPLARPQSLALNASFGRAAGHSWSDQIP